MLRRTAEEYGAGFEVLSDAAPIEDPSTELSAAYYERLAEDVAQGTRAACRAILVFTTSAASPATAVRTQTCWGDTLSYAPVITRTGVGLYTLTYPASFLDGLNEAETVSFFSAKGEVSSLTEDGYVRCTVAGAVINVVVRNSATNAASDFTAGTTEITIWAD